MGDELLTVFAVTRFEGIHCWPDAPDEVSFLRTPHRHEFHVKLEVQVYHDDRDVEFILLKRWMESWLKERFPETDIGHTSCEMIAKELRRAAKAKWGARWMECIVSEDGENGSRVTS